MLNELKMNKSELVKVTKQLVAANGDQLALNKAVFLSHADGVCLSLGEANPAVKDSLQGNLPHDFTKVTVQPQVAKCTATKDDKGDGLGCNCPTRGEALDPPRFSRNASPAELKDTIRKHYASSVNICKKQKFPIMQGQPCELFVNTKARPFTIYKHNPLAIYWAPCC